MCSYQDTQILSKRIFSTLGLSDDSQEPKSFSVAKKDQEGVINDILIKKKKMFGIFPNFFSPPQHFL